MMTEVSEHEMSEEHGPMTLLEIAKQWGIFAAMVAFFLWVGYTRDQALDARVSKAEEFQRETLTSLVTNSTMAIQDSTRQQSTMKNSIDQMTDELKGQAVQRAEYAQLLKYIADTLKHIDQDKQKSGTTP